MFCHKCGAKMLDGSAFCAKCGARLLSENSSQTTETITTGVTGVTLERDNDIMPQQPSSEQSQTVRDSIPMHTSNLNDDAEFRSFVNKRVQEMTKCSSAEELLKKHPMRIPLILCYGFFIFIGIMISKNTDNIGLALILIAFCILLAYGLSYLIGWATILRYLIKHRSELNGEISSLDTDNLILFLNNRLAYLRPGLGEWGYFSMGYEKPEKMAAKLVVRHLEKREKNTMHIGAQCSKWYSPFSIISLRCDEEKPDVTGYGIKSGFTTAINYNMSIYECMYRSAPIVSAAMEYYREHRQTIVESSEQNFALEDNVLKINSKLIFQRYVTRLVGKMLPLSGVVTRITLDKTTNKSGQPYAIYNFEVADVLPADEAAAAKAFGEKFMSVIDSTMQ
ncbi:MAG: zinc ribbon domain-containing protein [Oscillospiraceae bacterium]